MIVLLKHGKDDNISLGTIKFDRYGTKTNQEILVCENFDKGLAQANSYNSFLLVDSGTYFTDWYEFCRLLRNYPHKGIIAHILRGNGFHSQCMYIERQCLKYVDFSNNTFKGTVIESDKNIHDDYTPLSAKVDGQLVVNFNNRMRGIKKFKYPNTIPNFAEYKQVAENQLWVYNNEPVEIINANRILMPGSGLYWLLQAAYTSSNIQILDISHSQVNFCKYLLENWDGNDYKKVAHEFILKNNIKHYADDFPVNLPEDFPVRWQSRTSTVSVQQGDIIEHVLAGNTDYDYIWQSNILNYKWGLITHNEEKLKKFNETIRQT